ncbi:hypothetical protein HanPI659440_Chr16g0629171 [Helianthus annuus]|nr:hypothetical protein HanPI659440_Chr16g0629171 [Helianthus annuus]
MRSENFYFLVKNGCLAEKRASMIKSFSLYVVCYALCYRRLCFFFFFLKITKIAVKPLKKATSCVIGATSQAPETSVYSSQVPNKNRHVAL